MLRWRPSGTRVAAEVLTACNHGFSGKEIVRYLPRVENECTVVRGRHYRERPAWLTLAGLSLLGLLVLAAVSCGGGGSSSGGQRAEEPAGEAGSGGEQAAVDLDHPSLGDENAPVVLTEYADYQ